MIFYLKKTRLLFLMLATFFLSGCIENNPNNTKQGEDKFTSHEVQQPLDRSDLSYNDTLYVPIYSDIYLDEANPKNLLTAILSIRNTSLTEELYVSTVDYYNSNGDLVKQFLKNDILFKPMQTIDYYIEKNDDTGGSGANFIVSISSKSNAVKPVVQAVMINSSGNKSFAFTTQGYSISRK